MPRISSWVLLNSWSWLFISDSSARTSLVRIDEMAANAGNDPCSTSTCKEASHPDTSAIQSVSTNSCSSLGWCALRTSCSKRVLMPPMESGESRRWVANSCLRIEAISGEIRTACTVDRLIFWTSLVPRATTRATSSKTCAKVSSLDIRTRISRRAFSRSMRWGTTSEINHQHALLNTPNAAFDIGSIICHTDGLISEVS